MDLGAALLAFGLVFIAELGDKTQLAVIALTARTGRMLPVVVGGTLGLIAAASIGAVIGGLLGEVIPLGLLSRLVGVLFLLAGFYLLWEWRKGGHGEDEASKITGKRSDAALAASTFGLIFLAEVGDKTQLAVVGLAATRGPAAVFLGAALALVCSTLLAALAARVITHYVPLRMVSLGAALLFLTLGVLTLGGVV